MLPVSYGESHLLLLARDPQTLFAAWDMAPASIEAIRVRIGKRALAVSTLTLRFTRAGGTTSAIHVARKSRSKYLKIQGGSSFMAEIGFTTPAGRFELLARSAPCFAPAGASGRPALLGEAPPTVLSYREARDRFRRETAARAGTAAARSEILRARDEGMASTIRATIGGASDLYRR